MRIKARNITLRKKTNTGNSVVPKNKKQTKLNIQQKKLSKSGCKQLVNKSSVSTLQKMNKKELICALSTFIIQGCWLRPNGGFQQDCGLLWDLWWQQLLSKDVRVDRSSLVSLLKTLRRRLQNGQIRLSKYNNATKGRG